LKRLLLFGERVWGELRGAVQRQERARAAARAEMPPSPAVAALPDDIEEDDREPAVCLSLELEICNWWELQLWGEMPDENSIWGDPGPETLRLAAELLHNKRMDT